MNEFLLAIAGTFEIFTGPFITSSPFILCILLVWKAGVFDLFRESDVENEKETSLYYLKEMLKCQNDLLTHFKKLEMKLDEVFRKSDK